MVHVVFYFRRIAENRRRHRLAEVDIDAAPLALVVRVREPGQALAHAALQIAALAHRLQSCLGRR
jgi:hypothetical protein